MPDSWDYNAFLTDPAGGQGTAPAFNWESYQQQIQETMGRTTDIGDITPPPVQYGDDPRVQAALATREAQVGSIQDRAKQSAMALGVRSAGFERYMKNLDAIRGGMAETKEKKGEEGGADEAAIAQAATYVEETKARTDQVRAILEGLDRDMTQEREEAKAHSAQVAVQSILGQYGREERRIADQYGLDSAEWKELQGEKSQSLAAAGSQIQVEYQRLAEAQRTNILNATVDTETKMHMYTGFQEQQHVEIMAAVAKESDAWDLNYAQSQLALEGLSMAGFSEMADYIASIPDYYIDNSEIVALMSEIGAERRAEEEAKRAQKNLEADRRGSLPNALPTGNRPYRGAFGSKSYQRGFY